MLDPIRENARNLEKQRLVRRYDETMAHTEAQMAEIRQVNSITAKEVERISKLEDPIKMFEDRKDENKAKYRQMKQRLSQMKSLNGRLTMTKSPEGKTELLESFFEKSRSPSKHGNQKHHST